MSAKRITIKAQLSNPNKKKEARQENTPWLGSATLVCFVDGKQVDAVDIVAWYNPKGSGMQPVRASVWTRPADKSTEWRSGRGDAGGYGYHKASAAIADAIQNAGFDLYGTPYSCEKVDFKKRCFPGGTGSHWYEDAARAIAKALGYKGRMVWVSHGL